MEIAERWPSEMVSVHYRLRIPGDLVREWMEGHPPLDGEDDDSWVIALEEKVKDRLPDLLSYAVDGPDVEAA